MGEIVRVFKSSTCCLLHRSLAFLIVNDIHHALAYQNDVSKGELNTSLLSFS
jgi:hypothetical protein